MPDLPSTAVIPGRGTVTVVGHSVVVASSSPPHHILQALAQAVEGGPGPVLLLESMRQGMQASPGFGVAILSPPGWLVILGPGMQLHADHIGHRITSDGPLEQVLVGTTRLAILTSGATADLAAPVGPTQHGTRSGSGVIIQTEATLGQVAPSVEGVICRCGAFVHPMTVLCISCRQVLDPPRRTQRQPGVAVGRIVLDDGRAIPLAGPVVIGRDPASSPVPGGEGAASLMLSDSQRSVSRSHVLIHLDGWDVVMQDCHANNGTAVRPASSGEWTVLVPGASVRILPGTEVTLGRRTFRLVA